MAAVLERQSVTVRPTGAALGADIEGVDLSRDLSAETVEAIKAAWGEHLVLRFRGQRLDDDRLMRFSAHFGELDLAPVIAAARAKTADGGEVETVEDGPSYVSVISNIVENGKAIGALGNYESIWHTDMSYNRDPPCASALYALEVPPSGGDTGFANMYLAYERLPEALRREIEGRRCRHDSSRNSAGELRRGMSEVTDPREAPGASHPIVRTHPVTGRKALFLGRRRNAYIEGMPLDESERLLDRLWEHATRRDLAWYQQWRVGDLVMWDNRCTLHRRDEFDPSTRRLMHRTQIKGDRPF
jgi:taurine dioxygenase